jgi:hypothetical protein
MVSNPSSTDAGSVAILRLSSTLVNISPEESMLFALAALLTAATGQMPFGTPSEGGLTGSPALPTSDVLPYGAFAVGCSGGVFWPGPGGTAGLAELRGCLGVTESMEAGISVPVWLSDGSWESGAGPGDVTLAAKYLYEEVRGGTALAFTGRLRLPTGDIPRDRGSELGIGFCTSTTYRLFRLSFAAEYALAGGADPFDSRIEDRGYFGLAGTSFITPDLETFAGLSGCTSGSLSADAGVILSPFENYFAWLGARVALQGEDLFAIRAGVSTTREI